MNEVLSFLSAYVWVYLWLIFTTFINIIAPIQGSIVVTPVTAFFTDPQRAIGISSLVFFLTGLHRLHLFRKETFHDTDNRNTILHFLPYSALGAIVGSLLIASLDAKLLAGVIVVVSGYYVIQALRRIRSSTPLSGEAWRKSSLIFVAALSGFFQGAGMPGGDIRHNYLRTRITEVSVRAVSSAVGVVNFLIAGSIMYVTNHLTRTDIVFILTIVPLLMIVQIYGKAVLEKIDDQHAKFFAIILSLFGILLLIYKYFL